MNKSKNIVCFFSPREMEIISNISENVYFIPMSTMIRKIIREEMKDLEEKKPEGIFLEFKQYGGLFEPIDRKNKKSICVRLEETTLEKLNTYANACEMYAYDFARYLVINYLKFYNNNMEGQNGL